MVDASSYRTSFTLFHRLLAAIFFINHQMVLFSTHESFPETVSASQGFICPSLPFQFSRVFMTKPGLGTESSRWVTELLSDRVVRNPWLWIIHLSPIHTARWSRKIARKLPECLLCERKHVPGLIPGLIPGWGPSNIAGFSPGTSAVWTKAGSMP